LSMVATRRVWRYQRGNQKR